MIAVTGAAGFIGSNLAHRLAVEGADLLLVDHPLTTAKAANLVGLKRFQFVEHDRFLDDLATNRIAPETIFHLGACSATTELNWDYLRRNNIEYSQHLWAWCARNRKPFVYASSAATYGDGCLGFDDATHPSKLKPLNLYGKSKNDFDIWALAQSQTPPRWAGLKFFNVYGPREQHKGRMASVAWQAYQQITATGAMKLFRSTDPAYPDGGQLRDFVYVENCISHMLWLARHDHAGGLYNSGAGRARSFRDLTLSVFASMSLPANIHYVDMPTDLAKQYQNYTQATMAKLHSIYRDPSTSLEDGVRRYVEWLKKSL
jgi:ADP-L-glycero-D-manno-heptose 6-epimerase